ncbi:MULTISPECIES: DUF982 domain-containing protein [Chelativorans]|jgi:hypothetical protein|uniref:DUF982 domain-containing protein n=1 Tax=Chelativorans sp. (strain BNC1) TaxID=266779 RepID=Q11K27_CHESB
MNDKAFPTPVELRLEHNIRKVSTVFEALECLLGPWPITTCREYRSAVRACRDCLDGLRSPVAAYRAFKAASRVAEALLAKAAPGRRWIPADSLTGYRSSADLECSLKTMSTLGNGKKNRGEIHSPISSGESFPR